MKYLRLGLIVVVIVTLISFISGNWSVLLKVSGTIGVVSFLIAALLTGTFISGDQLKANWSSESKEDRDIRESRATKFFLFALPNFAGAIIYVVLK